MSNVGPRGHVHPPAMFDNERSLIITDVSDVRSGVMR